MEIKSVNHVYQAAPPYLDNRERPTRLMAEVLQRLQTEQPKLSDQELWHKAAAEVEEKHDMIWFGLTGVSMPETDILDRQIAMLYSGDYARDKAGELDAEKRLDQVKKHVVSIKNLIIDGQPVTDFDTFYRIAPKELVRWVCDAVHSCIVLSGAEIKNFMPGSALAA